MAHLRARHLEEPFKTLLRHSRIVGVLGHRQVGKTTFLISHCNDYVTLDDEETYERAKEFPKRFIEGLKGDRSAIDECQLVPGLFPALKVKIGTSSRPGRFILSGSVRFTSRGAIRESLTGRISNLELFPFTLTELAGVRNGSFVTRLMGASSCEAFASSIHLESSVHRERVKLIDTYSRFGGLPGLCFVRSVQTRKNLLRDIIETILDRDIRLVYPTTLAYRQIFEFCREIARRPGEPIRAAEMKRATGISESTQKKLLQALEAVYLIRRIEVQGDYRGDLFWFEDQLERHFFVQDDTVSEEDWIGLAYRNIRGQFGYSLGDYARYSTYRTRGGAHIPLVVTNQGQHVGVFVVESPEEVNLSRIRSAESFLKKHDRAKIVFAARAEKDVRALNERMLIAPLSEVLFT